MFLAGRGLDWREVRLEDVGEFVAWLRLPPQARDGRVSVLPSVEVYCGEATVNRKLSAVSAFYQHATASISVSCSGDGSRPVHEDVVAPVFAPSASPSRPRGG